MRLLIFLIATILASHAAENSDTEGEESRKILGSSVVTSVSVVMDTGNGSKAVYSDALGKPQAKPSNPSEVASPINLLNPDRYEFYTFDDNGDLVKRLMSLEEIQSIIATGDSDGFSLDSFTSQGFMPEKRVNDVVNNVQNVLKEEIELHKDPPDIKPLFDTPDVSDSWSMILPAIFGNSGEDIKPEKPIAHVTADTMLVEPNMQIIYTTSAPQKLNQILTSSSTMKQKISSSTTARPRSTTTKSTPKPSQSSTTEMITKWTQLSESNRPMINVEIYSNSKSTTAKPIKNDEHVVEIKPSNSTREKDKPTQSISTTTSMKTSVTTAPTVASSREEISTLVTTKPTTSRKPVPEVTSYASSTDKTDDQFPDASQTPTITLKPVTLPTVAATAAPTKRLPTFVPSSIGSTMPTTTAEIKTTSTFSTQPLSTRPQTTATQSSVSTSTAALITSSSRPTTKNDIKLPISTLLTSINSLLSSTERIKEITEMPFKDNIKPMLVASSLITKHTEKPTSTTEATVSTWRPKPTDTSISQSPLTAKTTVSTWRPEPITKEEEKNTILTEPTARPTTMIPAGNFSSSTEFVKLFTITSSEATTTVIPVTDKLTTLMTIADDNNKLETTTLDYLTTQTDKNEQVRTTTKNEDLSTLQTEYVGYSNKLPTTEVESSTQLSLDQALNNQQKVSASALLDQLLITTNIYEINTELSDKTVLKQNTSDESTTTQENIYETTTNNGINISETTTELPTTTDEVRLSVENSTDNIYETTELPKTTPNLLESIEQLLSQAVGNVEETLNVTNTIKIQQMLDSSNKTMADIIKDSATLASGLMDLPTEQTEKENLTTEQTMIDLVGPDDILSDSMDSLLSQVYGLDMTTIDQVITTEKYQIPSTVGQSKTTPITNRKSDEEIFNITSTETLESTTVSEEPYDAVNFEETTTILPKENITAASDSIHLINITVISAANRTKPAKADLSLEQMYFENFTSPNSFHSSTTLKSNVQNPENISNTEIEISTTTADLVIPELYYTTEFSGKNTEILTEMESITTEFAENSTFGQVNEQTTLRLETTSRPQTSSTYSISSTTTRVKPSIVITISENSTKVTENGNLVAERPIVKPELVSSDEKQPANITPINSMPLRRPENISDDKWTLVSTLAPHKAEAIPNIPPPTIPFPTEIVEPPAHIDLVPKPMQGFGLEDSTSQLDVDIYQFVQLCNELAFGFWKTATMGLSSARSVVVSPFAATSLLAMVFLGARGATSGEMNEILKLDDMVTFNPHLIFKNVSESIRAEPDSGIALTAIIRELFSDRSKGKLLDFYKNRARAFYDGYVEEVSYREISDVIRRRTNLLVKKQTDGKILEYLKDSSLTARPPLTGISVSIFQTDCSQASTSGRDGELHFVVLPSIRQRRLVPIPAVVLRSGFLAGYEPSLDATAVALGTKDQIVSTIFVIPGQQGVASPGDGLARLEKRLIESSFKKGAWSRLLRSLISRTGMEVQIPRFSHRSVINATNTLKRMGLHELFDPEKADLRGLNGVANELHLSDMIQINNFATCGESRIAESHHSEIYPATATRARSARFLNENEYFAEVMDEPRDYQRAFHDPLHDPSYLSLPLSLRPRQARVPEVPRLKFDRPFMYFVRHNPTGLILHMGRFNPRLLP